MWGLWGGRDCLPQIWLENFLSDKELGGKFMSRRTEVSQGDKLLAWNLILCLTKKDNGEVWFRFYFWQVWSALLWAASSKPLQMLPFDPLCLKSLSHFSLKQRMKDLFSVIELMSYHQAVWTEQNRCWYLTNFQIGVFMKIVQGRGRRNRRRI